MVSVNETRAKDLVAAIDELTSVRGLRLRLICSIRLTAISKLVLRRTLTFSSVSCCSIVPL